MTLRLAWRSAWRNPRRTGILIAAVSIGLAGCLLAVGLNLGMVMQMVETAISTELGHLQIHRAGWTREPSIELSFAPEGAAAMALGSRPELVQAFAPRVRGEGLVSSARASVGVRVLGVDPLAEPTVSIVPASITEGSFLEAKNRAFLGAALAKRLKVDVGKKIVVSVQTPGGDLSGRGYRVGGLFETASTGLDESTLYLSLSDAQDLFELGESISEFVVVTNRRSDIESLRSSLSATLAGDFEVQSWEELQPMLVVLVESFDLVSWYLYGAVFVAMAFGIANVLLMAVYERTREIGMMMALGMKPRRVVALVVTESALVTSVGLLVGLGLAGIGLFWLQDGIELGGYADSLRRVGSGTRIVPHLSASDFTIPLGVAFVATLAASAWPAIRAARLRPGSALRHV